ncbi:MULTISPECIES: M48 family metallopeptidase [Methylomonas]|uniref:Peptidase n=2 Tax=Methylomonas TaxID=416 RepID=A0A126T5U1_9GAMM|nr:MULTISPECIES: M48 family metallopeptidase [Methylomonas]AMK77453.1 peptidase [Methylomonas denitrificans]OAI05193.1 peptidase [Methylomonas methanica]TCV84507.1 peptidase M48-like protein [Methylomonas methanica]
MLKKLILSSAVSLLLNACATSPTGRSQFIYMSDNQVDQMGLQSFSDMKSKNPISQNTRYSQFASCVAQAITQQTGGQWEVVVFEDETLNAFALPGNKIGVHTGLINLVDNQDQLAAVIGHEVGHVLARHSNERLSQETAVSTGLSMVQAVSQPQTALGQTALGLLGVGAQYGVILPFSRVHETEADTIGLDLMAKAGFDPRQSVNLWLKMDKAAQGGQPIEFMSTHPSHASRIDNLNQNMSRAVQLQQQAWGTGRQPRCAK